MDGRARPRWRAVLPSLFALGGLLAVVLAFASVEAGHAAGYSQARIDDYDEGAYTISAQLLLAGYHLFAQVFSAQPAWFLGTLALGMRLLGQPTLAGAHLVEMACGVLALLGIAGTAWAAYGPLAAVVSAAVLALSPAFLVLSHTVEAEMPMMGMALLAVAAAAWSARAARRVLVVAAGLLLGAALEMKLLGAVFAVPVGLWAMLGTTASRRAPVAPARPLVALGVLSACPNTGMGYAGVLRVRRTFHDESL